MTARFFHVLAALGLLVLGCDSPETARLEVRSVGDREKVFDACSAVFGAPVDADRGFFDVDQDFVLEAQFDEGGHLLQLGVFPKHWFGDAHPEWDATEDVGEMSETQYEDLLGRLDGIVPRGALVQRDESPVVQGTELRRRDEYEQAVVVTGDVVDDTRREDAPRAVKYLIVYPSAH